MWQPIETAPKDNGTRILVTKDCGNGSLASISVVYWCMDEWRFDSSLKSVDDYGYRVTHWMPLPELPSTNGVRHHPV